MTNETKAINAINAITHDAFAELTPEQLEALAGGNWLQNLRDFGAGVLYGITVGLIDLGDSDGTSIREILYS